MKITFFTYFLGLLFFNYQMPAQTLIATLPLEVRFVRSGAGNQTYLVTEDNSVVKIDSQGKETARFQQANLGFLKNFDLSNLFKPLAYYPDFQTIVFLDKQLNPINQLDLKTLGFSNISAVCSYLDNQLLLADEANGRIFRVDYKGKTMAETTLTNPRKEHIVVDVLASKGAYCYALVSHSQILYLNAALRLEAMAGHPEVLPPKHEDLILDMDLQKGILYTQSKGITYCSPDDDFSQQILETSAIQAQNELAYKSHKRIFILSPSEIKIFAR